MQISQADKVTLRYLHSVLEKLSVNPQLVKAQQSIMAFMEEPLDFADAVTLSFSIHHRIRKPLLNAFNFYYYLRSDHPSFPHSGDQENIFHVLLTLALFWPLPSGMPDEDISGIDDTAIFISGHILSQKKLFEFWENDKKSLTVLRHPITFARCDKRSLAYNLPIHSYMAQVGLPDDNDNTRKYEEDFLVVYNNFANPLKVVLGALVTLAATVLFPPLTGAGILYAVSTASVVNFFIIVTLHGLGRLLAKKDALIKNGDFNRHQTNKNAQLRAEVLHQNRAAKKFLLAAQLCRSQASLSKDEPIEPSTEPSLSLSGSSSMSSNVSTSPESTPPFSPKTLQQLRQAQQLTFLNPRERGIQDAVSGVDTPESQTRQFANRFD